MNATTASHASARFESEADVRLGRVVLRGSAEAIETARATLPAALARTRWPGAGDEAIVVMRRIAVHGDATELPARAAAAAALLARDAADPWHPAADHADAVRFRDPLDYRACLLHDLLAGTAPRRWLWRHRAALLDRPLAEAIVELLGEDILALPDLLDRIAPRSPPAALWRALDVPAARAVLNAIGATTGWGSAIAYALDSDLHAHVDDWPRVSIPSSLLSRLVAPLPSPSLPAALGGDDPRVVLQAVLLLWTTAPATLTRAGAASQLHALARRIVGLAPAQPPAVSQTPRLPPSPPPGKATDASGLIPSAPVTAHRGAAPALPAPDKAFQTRPAMPAHPAKPADAGLIHSRPTIAPPPTATPEILARGDEALAPAADFHTRFCGVFFLLNALDQPALRDWRARLDEAHAGWRELVRLARALGFLPDPPLAAFLAAACGLDDEGDALSTLERLSPGADPDTVLRATERHYGEAALRAARAERPARVTATRSHLDVRLRLADASVDVRRTGLDLDPGWLPWLGRVVHFHYDSRGFFQ